MRDADRTQISKLAEIKPDGRAMKCLVMIYGENLGRKYDITGDRLTIGRGPDNDIVLTDAEASREHAVIEQREGSVIAWDNHSTNGILVNDRPVTECVLQNGDHLRIGSTIFKFLYGGDVETLYHEAVYQLTILDGLTQIPNKRYLLDFLEKECSRARRYRRPLSLVMCDLDLFKRINDEHGHLSGDFVLKALADLVRFRVRKEEFFARYGGEEFVLVLPETPLAGAVQVARKLRELVEQFAFTVEGRTLRITISAGVAEWLDAMNDHLALLAAADEKLYEAKREGRNRVCS